MSNPIPLEIEEELEEHGFKLVTHELMKGLGQCVILEMFQ